MTTTKDAAAIYLRVSTDDQAQGFSLTEQQERCEGHARSQGWDVAGVWTDEGESGAKSMDERAQGADLMRQARAGAVSHIITAKLDRWTRSLVNGAADLEAMDELGVSVTFLDLGVNTATDAGKLALRMLMAVADFERTRIANRMATGRLGRLRGGQWPGGKWPYGFTVDDDGFLTADIDQERTVLRIFHLLAQGQGATAVAHLLNAEGIPAPGSRAASKTKPAKVSPWTHQAISELVRRGDYYSTGRVERTQGPADGLETHALAVPVMVSAEVVAAARKVLARNSQAQQQKRKTERTYALTGHLRHLHGTDPSDLEHSVTMSGKYRPSATTGRYMWCSDSEGCPGFRKHGDQNVRTVPAAKVEAGVILWGIALLNDADRITEWVANFDRQELGDAADDSMALTRALERRTELEKRKTEMVKALDRGLITADALEGGLDEVAQEQAENEAAIERLASVSAHSEAMRLSVDVLRNSGPLVSHLMSADIAVPLPARTGADVDSWPQLESWLEGEAHAVLAGIEGQSGGKPRKDAPVARDIHPAATEWARALASHLSIMLVLAGEEPADWTITGAVPVHGGGPGTMGVKEVLPQQDSPVDPTRTFPADGVT